MAITKEKLKAQLDVLFPSLDKDNDGFLLKEEVEVLAFNIYGKDKSGPTA